MNGSGRPVGRPAAIHCPFCGAATNCDDDIEELHFCFSCGAEMDGE